MLDYYRLAEVLQGANAAAGAAECHGFLCGQICAAGFADARQWQEYLAIEDRDSDGARECVDEIHSLVDEMRILIASPDFEFRLLLPDDDSPLGDRVHALGGWCHGFLNGFGMNVDKHSAKMDEETRELIEDFTKICRVGLDEEKDDADERALVELVEYVRIGAMSLFDSLQSDDEDDNQPKVVH